MLLGADMVCLGRNLNAGLVITILIDKSGFKLCPGLCNSGDPPGNLSDFN